MEIDRRTLITGAGAAVAASLSGTPSVAAAPPPMAWSHELFATKHIDGLFWFNRSFEYAIDPEVASEALERGIHIEAEVRAALVAEHVTTFEQQWLSDVRGWSEKMPTYKVGLIHPETPERLDDLILANAAETDNTVIVSPTALTVIQAYGGPNFLRHDAKLIDWKGFGIRCVGVLGGRLNVLVDAYAKEDVPVLIGRVEPTQEGRDGAILVLGKAAEVRVGRTLAPFTARPDWKSIPIDVSSATFI